MFADTDFILALVKDSDWLKDKVAKLLKGYEGKISTSISVMIEVALICKRLKINAIEVFSNVFELVNVNEETYAICMRAALYTEKYELNVFDAFHAAYCSNDEIISSDSVYEKVGIERVKLEK